MVLQVGNPALHVLDSPTLPLVCRVYDGVTARRVMVVLVSLSLRVFYSHLVSKDATHWVSICVWKAFLKTVLHFVSSTLWQCLLKLGTCFTTLTTSYFISHSLCRMKLLSSSLSSASSEYSPEPSGVSVGKSGSE